MLGLAVIVVFVVYLAIAYGVVWWTVRWIGVGNGDRHPLPPNPLCGFPATGSPVSCFLIGIGAPMRGLRTS